MSLALDFLKESHSVFGFPERISFCEPIFKPLVFFYHSLFSLSLSLLGTPKSIENMASPHFLEMKYNLSKRSFLRRPSRLLSGERQNSGLQTTYQVHMDELKLVFDKFDLNKDGKISPDEYMAILKALGSRCLISKEVKEIFEVADLNGDGFIDFKEFLEVQQKEGGVRVEDLQSAFRTFDMDGDGKITVDEVFELLKRLGEKCSMKDCRKMVRVLDTNGDGVIDMDEFLAMMTRTMNIP